MVECQRAFKSRWVNQWKTVYVIRWLQEEGWQGNLGGLLPSHVQYTVHMWEICQLKNVPRLCMHHRKQIDRQTDRQIRFIGLINITVLTIKYDDEGDSIKPISCEPSYNFHKMFIIAIINDKIYFFMIELYHYNVENNAENINMKSLWTNWNNNNNNYIIFLKELVERNFITQTLHTIYRYILQLFCFAFI